MKLITLLLTSLITLSPLVTLASTGAVARAEAQALLESLAQHFSDIHSLSYTAERTTQGRRQSSRERWFFAYQAPGFVRVNYQYPVERVLVLNTNTLYEYIPALRKALQTDLAKLSAADRQSTIKQTLTRISLDGINPAKFQEMVSRTTAVVTPPLTPDIIRISGTAPKFLIELNQQQKVLKTTDIYTSEDNLLMHTDASQFIEVSPGFWYPRQLETRYWTDQGFVNTTTLIQDISINTPLTNSLFEFTPPARVTLETRR